METTIFISLISLVLFVGGLTLWMIYDHVSNDNARKILFEKSKSIGQFLKENGIGSPTSMTDNFYEMGHRTEHFEFSFIYWAEQGIHARKFLKLINWAKQEDSVNRLNTIKELCVKINKQAIANKKLAESF